MRNKLIFVGLSTLLCVGCTVGPDYQKPDAWQPSDWQALPNGTSVQPVDGQAQSSANDVKAPDNALIPVSNAKFDAHWWKYFNDPVLEALQQRASQENLDIRQSLATILESRAQRRVAAAGLYPSLTADASGEREKSSQKGLLGVFSGSSNGATAGTGASGSLGNGVGGVNGSLFAPLNIYQDGFDLSWQLDLFGQVRRSVESADATLLASRAAERGMMLSVAAEVATNYINFRNAQATLALENELLRTSEDTLRLTTDRAKRGIASEADVANAQAQVDEIRAQIPQYEATEVSSANALALLVGTAPGSLAKELSTDEGVPFVGEAVPIGLSSEVVKYRPDILQADANLHAAVANVGVAKANFYPSVSLSASGGFQSTKLSELGSWNARQFSFGPTLSLPIFNGGQLSGTLHLRQEQAQGAALAYQKTVLTAWREVDTGLATLQSEARREKYLALESIAAERAFKISRDRYGRGLEQFLTVLDAERTMLNAKVQHAASQASLAIDVVQLYQAIGGGWSTDEQPSSAAALQYYDECQVSGVLDTLCADSNGRGQDRLTLSSNLR